LKIKSYGMKSICKKRCSSMNWSNRKSYKSIKINKQESRVQIKWSSLQTKEPKLEVISCLLDNWIRTFITSPSKKKKGKWIIKKYRSTFKEWETNKVKKISASTSWPLKSRISILKSNQHWKDGQIHQIRYLNEI